MLINLSIHHLAVVEHLELIFKNGMSVLTGETGAGKSILMDALGLTLGERADSGIVRHHCHEAEVSAIYDIAELPLVLNWLKEHALDAEEECIIRRTLTEEGRSRAYINGKSVPLNQLRDLGEQLVNIHGQHQHQSLLKSEHQRLLLDEYANHPDLLIDVKRAYSNLQQLRKEFKELSALQGHHDKLALLQYQIQEIDELSLSENELEQLEDEHKQLAHADQWRSVCELALNSLKTESNSEKSDALSELYFAEQQLSSLKSQTSQLNSCHELLNNAIIQLQEAINELENFTENLNLDPERLHWVETRLSQIHALARKHRIQPEQILNHRAALEADASQLIHLQENLSNLTQKLQFAESAYQQFAQKLSASRQKAALQLEKLIVKSLQTLEMPNGRFKIEFSKKANEQLNSISANGMDDIEFLVSTNPGLPLQPLRKVASGGEMSRISLAIQVITVQKMTIPTLIFDEVDAGISGKTAETVGKLLKKLSKDAQVICITHLPQIAAEGDHHFKVEKLQSKEHTTTKIYPLDKAERVQELARMIGGTKITQHALLHAEELLG